MNLNVVKNAVTSKVGRQILLARKNSPVIMFVGGTVGMVGTAVLASRATLKLESVVEDAEKKRVLIETGEASYKTRANDMHILKIQTAMHIAKLYAPAIGLGVVSIGCLTGAHVTLSKRNTAVMAAYAALNKGFDEYRQRVRDEFGEEKEREIRYNGAYADLADEKGKKVRRTFSDRKEKYSVYARLWDQDSTLDWKPQPEYNLAFLTSQQNWMNDRLRARGHVFLNEVYDALGLSRTKEGAVVGWVLDGGNSDNYIDFGVFKKGDPQAVMEFITGWEGGIWLDFNVDGVIYDLIS